jgi:hypothetical protein
MVQIQILLIQVSSLLWDLGMSSIVPLFLCMTLIYFTYLSISYKVVLACLNDMFMCSSSVHHVFRVLDEYNLLTHLIGHLSTCSVFVYNLEAHVLYEHVPLILWYKRWKSRIRLCA